LAQGIATTLEQEFDESALAVEVEREADELGASEDLKVLFESTGEVLHSIPMLTPAPAPPTEMESLVMISKVGAWLASAQRGPD